MPLHTRTGLCHLYNWFLPFSCLWPSCNHFPTCYHCSSLCCNAHQTFDNRWSCYPNLGELHWLPKQACKKFQNLSLTVLYRVPTNSSPYVSSLFTSCSSLQSIWGLRSSSQADFAVTWSLRKSESSLALDDPAQMNRISSRTFLTPTLSHYCSSKLTLRLTYFCARFMNRLSCYAPFAKFPLLRLKSPLEILMAGFTGNGHYIS